MSLLLLLSESCANFISSPSRMVGSCLRLFCVVHLLHVVLFVDCAPETQRHEMVLRATYDVRHVIAVFEKKNLETRRHLFLKELSLANSRRHNSVHLSDVTLLARHDAYEMIIYICDAIQHHNVTAVLVFSTADITNVLYSVTSYLGLPLLAYYDDTKTPTMPLVSMY